MSERYWFVKHLNVVELELDTDREPLGFEDSAYFKIVSTGQPALLLFHWTHDSELEARKTLAMKLISGIAANEADLEKRPGDTFAFKELFMMKKAVEENDARIAEIGAADEKQ